jgi:ribonuclease G
VAQEKKVADLHNDLNHLVQKWKKMVRNLQHKKSPARVLDEIDRATSVLRDLMNETFSSIVVDDEQLFEDIKAYIENIAPGREKILRLHEGQLPLLEQYGVERQIKSAFGRSVSMSKGAYLVIEHTEACHVIDVNSGNRSNKDGNQEENALEVNLIAAKEIARQLKLRDMGGIVVVDFIDMQRRENRKKLFDELRTYMADDRAKHKILPPSKFGLVEITRQRVRPVLNIQTREDNPNGDGGKIDAPILIIDKLESKIQTLVERKIKGKVALHLHPFIAAYIKQGWRSPRFNWFMKYNRWISVIPRDAFTYMQYAFVDSNGEEMDL